MKKSSILTAGAFVLTLAGIASASDLILRINMATQVDTSKVESVGVECWVSDVHGTGLGHKWVPISLSADGSFYGRLDVTIEPLSHLSGVADMLANATTYKCFYTVKKRGSTTRLRQESDIPAGLEIYSFRGRPFRPTVSGRVVW